MGEGIGTDTHERHAPEPVSVDVALRKVHALERTVSERQQHLKLIIRVEPENFAALQLARQMLGLAERQLQAAMEAVEQQRIEQIAAAKAAARQLARVPPDLQALVERHGTWDQITADAWAKFDEDMRVWRERLLNVETMER